MTPTRGQEPYIPEPMVEDEIYELLSWDLPGLRSAIRANRARRPRTGRA